MITLQVEIHIDETKLSPAVVTGELARGFALLQEARFGVDDSVLSLRIETLSVKSSKRRERILRIRPTASATQLDDEFDCEFCEYRAPSLEDLAAHMTTHPRMED